MWQRQTIPRSREPPPMENALRLRGAFQANLDIPFFFSTSTFPHSLHPVGQDMFAISGLNFKVRYVQLIAVSVSLYYTYVVFNHSNQFVFSELDWTDPPTLQSPSQSPPSRTSNDLSFSAKVGTVRETSSLAHREHSRTLGAGGLFVVSLKRVEARRRQMDTLARALNLDFTYLDATDAKSSGLYGLNRIERILDRVRWQRNRLDEDDLEDGSMEAGNHPKPADNNPNLILDAFPFQWSKDALDNVADPLANELGISGTDYWTLELERSYSGEDLDEAEAWEARHPMPPLWQDETWRKSREALVNPAFVRNNMEKSQHLTLAAIACTDSHMRVIREIIRRKLDSAIVLEDDIDIEFSIDRILQHERTFLPPTWDILYLGHCWSATETVQPLIDPKATYLRQTRHTLCSHAYAVSLRGAYKIARFLRSPDFAYSRPIDHLFKDLIQMHYLESYTFVPALVVQSKEEESQIRPGQTNSAWKDMSGEWLVDSTRERIAMYPTQSTQFSLGPHHKFDKLHGSSYLEIAVNYSVVFDMNPNDSPKLTSSEW
ncbi:hypothetical protein J3R30DRAFT_3399373 [Lentinula aciculospora]|uniref:Glycosyl transferase family 25 domain-containing protein n=1 Tax=Lentinula aciculospora TaxID=153920 RepID=A0A9W9AT26_9AGAR|nr:hypothetical protein J3R30DRAFT_3399373 [Lentinula aciculospora]